MYFRCVFGSIGKILIIDYLVIKCFILGSVFKGFIYSKCNEDLRFNVRLI